jgi:hypothetical protein
MKTPSEWAELLGHTVAPDSKRPQISARVSLDHAAADAVHGWSRNAHHYQGEQAFKLTRAAYERALRAGKLFPTCAPEKDALPESERARFKGFKAAEATDKGKKALQQRSAGENS